MYISKIAHAQIPRLNTDNKTSKLISKITNIEKVIFLS